ncbi:hypothetical protein QL285_050488 [Trifolium repens]|nr:hypothetical protein QL285_050488 [Trifolium repens]
MVEVCSNSMNDEVSEDESFEGLENLVLSDEEGQEDVADGDDAECSRTDTVEGCIFSEVNAVNSLEDISKINFKHLSDEDVMRYRFLDLEMN